jgi:hypothetical protein
MPPYKVAGEMESTEPDGGALVVPPEDCDPPPADEGADGTVTVQVLAAVGMSPVPVSIYPPGTAQGHSGGPTCKGWIQL